MPAGGPRKGAGRPSIETKKEKWATRLTPGLIEKLKNHVKPAAQIAHEALTEWLRKNG